MKKPELLLPVGNIEAFFAAAEGGADAVYLGLPRFNARKKAANFTYNQLNALTEEAGKRNIKVYVTLNTLIKNKELPVLLDNLHVLTHLKIDAVIIQDWGVYNIIKKYFPTLTVHASTQMAMHNTLGAQFAEEHEFERIILARELTLEELRSIKKSTSIELEIFIHGALCYSFSGICLFSSYLGGMSANRGQCRQPCRRLYSTESDSDSRYLFSLKDFQLIDLIPKFSKIGIKSLKIEGRMKGAEYVYNTAKAYRIALDEPQSIPKAKQLLTKDMGREKTQYFMGNNVSEAITKNPFLGIEAGVIEKAGPTFFEFKTKNDLTITNRLRIQKQEGRDSNTIKIDKILKAGVEVQQASKGDYIKIIQPEAAAEVGDRVILTRLKEHRFKSKLNPKPAKLRVKMPQKLSDKILREIQKHGPKTPNELFVRIDNTDWIRKMNFKQFDKLIINLSRADFSKYDWNNRFLRTQSKSIIFQLPDFIPEQQISYYSKMIKELQQLDYNSFMISHISQLKLFYKRKSARLYASESVYTLNDAAAQFLKAKQLISWVYPLENDIDNLYSQHNLNGIVPLFFIPRLFYSRMPVNIKANNRIADNTQEYTVLKKDGMTHVIPQIPVSLLHYHNKLKKKGYGRYLIDLSYVAVSKNKLNRLINKFKFSEVEQPGTIFNFKEGLS